MATRIAFSTVYPERMGELAGKRTYFPEKIMKGLGMFTSNGDWEECNNYSDDLGYYISHLAIVHGHPKTTTIRKNYDYWKSKEGQLIQPFFWAGKPYRSKQVVFCPEVRLARVRRIDIKTHPYEEIEIDGFMQTLSETKIFTQSEGFDHPDHFWMWFNQDFDGALLEFESAGE